MAELALLTSDQEILGSNPSGENFAPDCVAFPCTEPFFITLLSSQYHLSDVERDVKHKIFLSQFHCIEIVHVFRLLGVSVEINCLQYSSR